MDSEILCLFLLESSEEIYERPKKLVWTENFFIHFHYWDPKLKVETFVDRSACRAKFTLQKALFDFHFSISPHFEKIDFLRKACFM